MENDERLTRIICIGSIHGKFKKLFSRIDSINKSHGPFEAIISPGRTFSEDRTEWDLVLKGELKCPVPLYILGPHVVEDIKYYRSDINECEDEIMAPNIIWLGSNGIYKIKSNITICYISHSYFSDHTLQLCDENVNRIDRFLEENIDFKGVDILLTPEWPKYVLSNIDDNLKPNIEGNILISKLASIIKPRYHFCISDIYESIYYERFPYKNYPNNTNKIPHLSYFVSLASFDNSQQIKDIYGLKISPFHLMPYDSLCQSTKYITDCPYAFYSEITDMDPSPFVDLKPMQKITHDLTPNCWFCLSNPNLKRHMVVHFGNYNYITLAKGGLVPYHILICPISHISCLAELDLDSFNELQQLKKSINKAFRSKNQSIVVFERFYHSQHLQLNIIPINRQNPMFLADLFIRYGRKLNFEFQHIPQDESLQSVLSPKPYFYIEFEDGVRLVHYIEGKFPIHFGREVLASRELLNLEPEKIDWRNCELSMGKETSLAENLKNIFQPFLQQ